MVKNDKGDHSVESMIAQRKWPAGGLTELQDIILSQLPWAERLSDQSATSIAKAVYDKFMQLMSAAIYCFSPQGRIAAVMALRFGQREELLTCGFVMSSTFKTFSTFGKQPVTCSKLLQKLLFVYIKIIRPVSSSMQKETDPLFINFTATKCYNVGAGVTSFFKVCANLHICTTTIRSIIETTVHGLQQHNLISNQQRAAVSNVNGHTSKTVKAYYVLDQRVQDVKYSTEVFDIIASSSSMGSPAQYATSSSSMEPPAQYATSSSSMGPPAQYANATSSSSMGPPAQYATSSSSMGPPAQYATFSSSMGPPAQYATSSSLMGPPVQRDIFDHHNAASFFVNKSVPTYNFKSNTSNNGAMLGSVGSKHPCINMPSSQKRAQWTNEEINFVGWWCTETLAINPLLANKIVSQCLNFIMSNKEARSIFHPIHVLSSGRLKYGYDVYKEVQLRKSQRTEDIDNIDEERYDV